MNINEILAKYSNNYKNGVDSGREEYVLISSKEVKAAIKEIIEETLRLASENARADLDYDEDDNPYPVIDKQSILDVIKQIEI